MPLAPAIHGRKPRPARLGPLALVLTLGLALVLFAAWATPVQAQTQARDQAKNAAPAKAQPAAKRKAKKKRLRPYIVVVAVPKPWRNQLTRKAGHWSPFLALTERPPGPKVPKRIDISGLTHTYAFLVDPTGTLINREVVFSWYYRQRPTLFVPPSVTRMAFHPGIEHPVAVSGIWSKPGHWGTFGIGAARTRSAWEKSRAYGPRLVKVSTLRGWSKGPRGEPIPILGKTLAKAYFEIHAPGVAVY